jgi:solute carrier family 25 carnitine/acylcarnitine transporter 20/29
MSVIKIICGSKLMENSDVNIQRLRMEWIDIVKDLYAGTIGGVAGIIAGHPLDTIKVRLQTECHRSKRSTILESFRSISQTEGFRGFYKGLLSPIISNAPINAIVFAVYGQASRSLLAYSSAEENATLSPLQQCLAGSMAGMFQVLFAAPSELVKIQMQVKTATSSKNYSSITCAREIMKAHGLYNGLYRGWQLTMLRDVPAFGSYFFTYDVIKSFLSNNEPKQETTFTLLLAGGLAGSLSWMITQPVDVVKTLAQSQPLDNQMHPMALVRHHLKLEGPKFLTKGFRATVLRAFPVSAVTFLVYERTMQFMIKTTK